MLLPRRAWQRKRTSIPSWLSTTGWCLPASIWYLFNHRALAKVFRGKLLAALKVEGHPLPKQLPAKWGDCKSVGDGEKALVYLGRYLYRGVLREDDILSSAGGQVRFRYRDSQRGEMRERTLSGADFLRVRPAHRDHPATAVRPEEWLLIEWPTGDEEPASYWLATAPDDATLEQLIFVAKMRWRIERDYRELKQEFGLSHYEGRNWRGFHHHATLCIAAYGFLTAHRLTHDDPKKNCAEPKAFALPPDYVPRGRPTRPAPRAGLDQNPSPRRRTGHRQPPSSLPLLWRNRLA